MIKEVHPPHQVMALGEVGTVHIVTGLELHLVSLIQSFRIRTSGRRVVIGVKKVLHTIAWGIMQ